MDETGEEGILAVKFPSSFHDGSQRSPWGRREASRSHLGSVGPPGTGLADAGDHKPQPG